MINLYSSLAQDATKNLSVIHKYIYSYTPIMGKGNLRLVPLIAMDSIFLYKTLAIVCIPSQENTDISSICYLYAFKKSS